MVCTSIITRRANKRPGMHGFAASLRLPACMATLGLLLLNHNVVQAGPANQACRAQIYLTFDTGNMVQAEFIADLLRREQIPATFFLANEKTFRGDYALDTSWQAYWQARVAEGHVFGSHSFDHVYLQRGQRANPAQLQVKPQFGAAAGKWQSWDAARYCANLRQVDQRFQELTGRRLDPIWRAPGGITSPASLSVGKECGYTHFGWAAAGFSGDELPSESHPNAMLLQKMLAGLKDGDIVMAHLGIWSRRDAWAPGVLPGLVKGLRARGFCFAGLRNHPDYPKMTAKLPGADDKPVRK